jgi:hypothetical protein
MLGIIYDDRRPRRPEQVRKTSIFLFLVSIFFVSCGPSLSPEPTQVPADSPALSHLPATVTMVPSATSAPTLPPALARPQYTMNVVLDYARKSVSVEQTISYPNQTGQSLSELVLAVEPNLWPNCFTLNTLAVDGTAINDYSLDGQKLKFNLPAPLAAGATLNVSFGYTLNLPEIPTVNTNVERPRIFGYTDRQINLTNWYPFIVPYASGQGWLLHDPWYYGEHLVYDAADYIVNIKPADPTFNPIIATSGTAEPNGEWTRYTLQSGRTFAISASTEFNVDMAYVGEVTVYSYYFPSYESPGKAVLQTSIKAIQVFSERYGPYPHRSLSAVMGDFNDGMEFSAFYFLPRDFYNLYDGTPKNYLTFVAVHETSHQWWFESVANDQALQPWLDEALATYSEHIFYEATHPELLKWWWSYRMYYYQPQAWMDITVYQGDGFQPYTNAVYFRGAHFLDDLRARIGDEAFFAFLQDYLTQEKGKIATAQDFFRILKLHTSVDYSDLLKTYFSHPPDS